MVTTKIMAEVFVYREYEATSDAVEFLTVRHGEAWGVLTTDTDELRSVADNVFPLSQPDFYAAQVSGETSELLAPENPHLWVCYDGLQGILEFKRNGSRSALSELGSRLPSDTNPCPSGTFHSAEWAVIVAKPDALERGLEAEIQTRLSDAGLQEVAVTEPRHLDLDDIEQIWVPPYKWEQPQAAGEWWYATVDYMRSGPSVAYLVTGADATGKAKAVKAALRQEHDCNPHHDDERPVEERVRSLMHCTDRTEELVRNAALFWEPRELLTMITEAKQKAA